MIFGFSCLARITKLKPPEFGAFLSRPCEDASEPLVTVFASRGLPVLLDAFLKERFGFAHVVRKKDGVGALVSLADFLGLLAAGVLRSKIALEEVASPVFSMPEASTIRQMLREMFGRRIRRVFIEGTTEFIWDRGVVDYLFSPHALARIAGDPSEDPLEAPISAIRRTTAIDGDPKMSLKEGAEALHMEGGQCLAFDGRVATPWDLVMKPWKARSLIIGDDAGRPDAARHK